MDLIRVDLAGAPYSFWRIMKKTFKDPIAYTERKSSMFGKAPTKEQATTGRFMDMGDTYGVGFRQPVGKEKASDAANPIPQRAECFLPDQAIR